MNNRQACSSVNRISKSTVLAMLQTPGILGFYRGERVQYISDTGKTYDLLVVSVGQDTVVLSNRNGLIEVDKKKVKKEGPASFLDKIPPDNWQITSFDPRTRVVCIAITTQSGIRNVSVILPVIQ